MTQALTKAQRAETEAALAASILDNEAKLSNSASMRETLIARMSELGKQAAVGAASLTVAAREFGKACADPAQAVADDNAEEIYLAFAKAHNAHVTQGAAEMHVDTGDKGKGKAAISIFRTFGKAGPAQLGDTLWDSALLIRQNITPDQRKVQSAYNALVLVNRRVAELAAKSTDGKTVAVSDEQLATWLTAEDKTEKTDAEKLAAAVKQVLTMATSKAFAGTALGDIFAPTVQFTTMLVASGKAPSKSQVEAALRVE